MATEQLNPGQSVLVTALPEDDSNAPGTTDIGSHPAWVSQDPTIATIVPAADGMTATLTAQHKPGTTQVDVTFHAVAFGPALTSSFNVTVNEVPATHLAFSFGTPS